MADTYQLTITSPDEISLVLSDLAIESHASTHLTAGSDPIQLATNAREGLASAAHITALEEATANITTLGVAVDANTSDIADIQATLGGGSGVLSVSSQAGSPITITGTSANPIVGIPASSSSVSGYMTASQFQKLASIASGATANSIAVTSPLTTVSSGGIQTLGIQAASTTLNGYLSASDKVKLDSITSNAALSTISVSSPLVKTGTTAPTISLPAATSSVNGYMIAADKSKLDSLTASTATTSALGYMSAADKTKLDGVTAGASITAITVSSPLVKTGTTAPALSIQAATTSQNGYLSSTDKTKLDSLAAVAPQVTKTFYSGPISGANANPTFRTIASTDLPTVAIAQGGTGAITAPLAVNALGFKYGRATVTAGSVAIADTAITANSIIVATQEFMGSSSAPVGTSSDLVIEWCTKNTSGTTTVVTTEFVQNTGAKYYALDPFDTESTLNTHTFFTDSGYTVPATDFIALFRGGSGPPALVTTSHYFWDSAAMLPFRSVWNYDVEAQYDLTYCTLDSVSASKIRVPQASNTWGVGKGGSLIIEPTGTSGLKVIIPRNLKMSAWGNVVPTGNTFSSAGSFEFKAMPTEKCYWFDGGFVPSTFTPPSGSDIAPSSLVYPSTVTPKPIYINGVATNVMFPRLRLASDVIVNNTPSTLNRISVAKTAGTGFTIYSSNTVDTHVVDYVSYTP